MKGDSSITYILTVVFVVAQLGMAYALRNTSWPVFLIVTYVVGGTIAHASHVLIHDLTHFAGSTSPLVNRAFAILNNVCIGVPTAISFGKYHADHHNYLG